MRPPALLRTADLFPEVHAALITLLDELGPGDWARPTACAGWSVHDVALHLLGGQVGNLSRRRDGFTGLAFRPGEELPAFVNRINDEWMQAARRISPRVTRDLLAATGPAVAAYFGSLDGAALGQPVSWAGPEPAPVWLDVAREYTEWWHHQQHIRDAVGRPGFADRRYLGPTLATFAHALPVSFDGVDAAVGTTATLTVAGEASGDWTVRRVGHAWRLYEGAPVAPTARATVEAEAAWRLFTRGLAPEQAGATLEGDLALARRLLSTVSIL